MRADLQQAIDTLEALRRDVTIHPATDAACATAILALRALRDAPVGVMHATTDGGFLVTSQGSHLDLKNGPPIFGQRVRLVVEGEEG